MARGRCPSAAWHRSSKANAWQTRAQAHETTVSDDAARSPRHDFRVLTQTRGGYDGGVMYDVQLQVAATGALVWAQTFTDQEQADGFRDEVERDLEELSNDEFRRKHSVPSST